MKKALAAFAVFLLAAVPYGLVLRISMGALPGGIPGNVTAPSAPNSFFGPGNVFWYDGGVGSVPNLTITPLYATAYFENGGILEAIAGFDGGYPPNVMFHDVGTLNSATSPAFTNLAHLYTTLPICTCTIVSGASSINKCVTQQDAGATLGPTADGGPVTTVVIGTLAADGGLWSYDCHGY